MMMLERIVREVCSFLLILTGAMVMGAIIGGCIGTILANAGIRAFLRELGAMSEAIFHELAAVATPAGAIAIALVATAFLFYMGQKVKG